MFKLRMYQVLYFLATLIEIIFDGIGKLCMIIAKPFKKLADEYQAKIIELDKEKEEEKENE